MTTPETISSVDAHPRFVEMLVEQGVFDSYNPECTCYACQATRDYFPRWLETKELLEREEKLKENTGQRS